MAGKGILIVEIIWWLDLLHVDLNG